MQYSIINCARNLVDKLFYFLALQPLLFLILATLVHTMREITLANGNYTLRARQLNSLAL